jgi:MFS transporter, ACS family, glucarate transporter
MLLLLFGLAFVAYVLRMSLSILAERIMPEFGLTTVDMGWVFGAFTVGYAAFQVPGGLYGERVGARRALTELCLLWGLLTLLTGLLPGLFITSTGGVLTMLVAVRFFQGVVQAPIFPIQGAVVAEWFPVARWALPNSLVNMGLTWGAAATGPVVAPLMVWLGWRATLYVTAPLALIALVWWWYARDDPREHPKISDAEVALIRAGRSAPGPPLSVLQVMLNLCRNRDVLLLTIAYTLQGYVFYIFFNWFFLYLVDVRGFGVLAGGFLTSVPWIVGGVAAAIGGQICDVLCQRIGPRLGCRLPCLVCMPLMGAFLMLGAMVESPYWAIVFLTLSFSMNMACDGNYWSAMTFVAREHTGTACGMMNMGSNVGGVVCGPAIPLLAAWLGWPAALGSGAVVALIGAVLWLWIRADVALAKAG